MDNALVIDLILAAVLIAGAVVGAARGLFKSLAGLVLVLAALLGASFLTNLLTPPITDAIAPKVEDSMVEHFEASLKSVENALRAGEAESEERSLLESLQRNGLSEETIRAILAPLTAGALNLAEQGEAKAVEAYRSAIHGPVRQMVSGIVRAVVMLVSYPVLLFALRVFVKVFDRLFDLPVLSTLNKAGGAVFGLVETALLLAVVLYVAKQFGVEAVTAHEEDSLLMGLFLGHLPLPGAKAV